MARPYEPARYYLSMYSNGHWFDEFVATIAAGKKIAKSRGISEYKIKDRQSGKIVAQSHGVYGPRRNPTMKRATKAKSKAASRYGVYVGSSTSPTLAYVSTKKMDANKAAAKLKLSGRVGIKIKQVGPNPISGKVPKVGWRKEYAKAAYAAMKAPGARRKRAATTGKIRRALNPAPSTASYDNGKLAGETDRAQGKTAPSVAALKARALRNVKESWRSIADDPKLQGALKQLANSWASGYWAGFGRRRNSAISIVGPSRARRVVNPTRWTNETIREAIAKSAGRGYGTIIVDPASMALVKRFQKHGKTMGVVIIAGPPFTPARGKYSIRVARKMANPGRKRNAASILMRRTNPKAKRKSSAVAKPRTRYMVQVGETPAWVGKLKSDANKAWKKLNAAGLKGLKIFKVQVNKVVKDGWRKAFKPGSSRNPSFPGRKGSGQRFKACVATMSKRPGVYDPEGLCAAIGRRKYGAKGMAKMARKGMKRNPYGGSNDLYGDGRFWVANNSQGGVTRYFVIDPAKDEVMNKDVVKLPSGRNRYFRTRKGAQKLADQLNSKRFGT